MENTTAGALARLASEGHEELVVVDDRDSGLRAVVAIHDTSLGPAVGGTRMRAYASIDDAVEDALRLSRAMTYKAALAGMDCGGGKAVIIGDPRQKSRALLNAYARLLERFGGRFHTGADMGFEPRDIAVLARHTRHVSHASGGPGDTAQLAALGVFESIRTASLALGKPLKELHVAVQGVGQVGLKLARLLHQAGVRLTLGDTEALRVGRAVSEVQAEEVPADQIYDVEADVFSPNAAGAVLNEQTIPRLRCGAVVGAANEQLARPAEDDAALHARGILWAPDYVANAGGLLSLMFERGQRDADGVRDEVYAIGDRIASIWQRSKDDGLTPLQVADTMAEERLTAAREARKASTRRSISLDE